MKSAQSPMSQGNITIVDSITDPLAWDNYVSGHPSGTFFHLTGWQRVLESTFKYASHSCVAMRDGRVAGILPLFRVPTLPFGSSLVSQPLAVYGGMCSDDAAVGAALLQYAENLARRLGVRFVEFRNRAAVASWPVKDLYVTFRKEIHGDQEKNLADIPRKQRRMIRQGEKHGLDARIGGIEYLPAFYEIYSHSVRNLGTPVYPYRLFEHLLAEFPDTCKILAVFRGQAMVAGVMTFFFRDEVLPYYGGALRPALEYAVNDFMYWKLMCYAAEHGYKIFDFGRSKKNSGSYDFKRHWGFEPTPLAYQYYLVRQKTLPDTNPLNPKFSLPIAVWKRLPLPVTQWLGPKVVRFFP